jgi:hypothetical protein
VGDRDELQALWQSQPVSQADGPRFGLIEDMTTPVNYPLSRAMRWPNAVALLLLAHNGWQYLERSSSMFEWATASLAVGACLLGAVALFVPLGKPSNTPSADASISEYRNAMAREFLRQTRVERRVYVPVFALIWLSMILRAAAEASRDGFGWLHFLLPLAFLAFFGWLLWYTREVRHRAARRILSGL